MPSKFSPIKARPTSINKLTLHRYSEIFPKLLIFTDTGDYKNTLPARFLGRNIVSSVGDEWKRFHRVASKAFSRIWPTEVIGGITLRFVEVLEREKAVDVSSWLKRLTFDVLSESVLDLKINVSPSFAKTAVMYECLGLRK